MPETLVQLSSKSTGPRFEVLGFDPLPTGSTLKVLFVYPNIQRVKTIQLGVAVLSSCLKRIGADTALFDVTPLPRGTELDAFVRSLDEHRPDLLAYSVRSNEWALTREMLAVGRSRGITQVVGGPHPTHAPDETVPFADAIVIGEGEGAIMDIARCLAKRRPLAGIPNTWVNTSDGVIKTPKRNLVHDLDDIPMPDWRLFDDIHYAKSFLADAVGDVRRVAAIEGSRGCPFTCTYCSNSALMESYNDLGKWRREKSPQRIVDELRAFRKLIGPMDFVYWVDEIWLTGLDRLKTFRDIYKPAIGVPFSIMERPECITEEKIRIMADAGLDYIAIGLESGDEELRTRLLDRRTRRDVLVRAFVLPKQYGIRVHAFTMLGLPGQDVASMLKTWRFMRRVMPDSAQFSIFYPLKGTKLHDQVVQMGMYDPKDSAEDYYSGTVLTQKGIDNALVRKYQHLFSRFASRPGVWPVVAFHLGRGNRIAFWLIAEAAPVVARFLRDRLARLNNLRRCTPGQAVRKVIRYVRRISQPLSLAPRRVHTPCPPLRD